MTFVHSRTDGGLILVEHSADEAAVARALKQHDPELELFREIDPRYMTWVWKVNRRAPDGSFEFVMGWRKDHVGEPLPLSMRIVDEVQRLDKASRGDHKTIADLEREHREKQRKEYLDGVEPIVREFSKKLDDKSFTPMPRSQSLAAARRKQRAKQKLQEFKP